MAVLSQELIEPNRGTSHSKDEVCGLRRGKAAGVLSFGLIALPSNYLMPKGDRLSGIEGGSIPIKLAIIQDIFREYCLQGAPRPRSHRTSTKGASPDPVASNGATQPFVGMWIAAQAS